MDLEILYVIAPLAAAAVYFVSANRKKKAKNKPKKGWYNLYSPKMAERPRLQGNLFSFDFPTDPTSHVHYLQLFSPPSLVGAELLRVRFSITGGGFVRVDPTTDPTPTVSLLLQRKGDDWGAEGPMEAYRWYSKTVTNLAAGEYEMTIPIDVIRWGDVRGGQDDVAFDETLRNLDNIGLVFGSAGGRGHGVYATQPSTFTLLELRVE